MPVFPRHDGDLIRGLPPMRRIMPYLMRTRNESAVFHDATYRMEAVLDWLAVYNRSHAAHATVFDVFLYACGQALHARPELNRFVSGGRLYQRRGVQVAFVVKREMADDGRETTVKVEILAGEPFPKFVDRLLHGIADARRAGGAADAETALVVRLPGWMLRLLVAAARRLDAWNLYPRFMTAHDPMYASLFLANLGSVGVSDAYHHLYEYGTVSLFGAMSAIRPTPLVEGGHVVANEALSVRYTFDERIHDAFYAARSLAIVQRVIEDPVRHLGAPDGEPVIALHEPAPSQDEST